MFNVNDTLFRNWLANPTENNLRPIIHHMLEIGGNPFFARIFSAVMDCVWSEQVDKDLRDAQLTPAEITDRASHVLVGAIETTQQIIELVGGRDWGTAV